MMHKHANKTILSLVVSLFILGSGFIAAQVPQIPDAQRLLQEALTQEFPAPLTVPIEAQSLSDVTPGGAQVRVSTIEFEGITQFSNDELLSVLGEEALGQEYDLGGLRALANEISQFYRDAGFVFARAFIPAQTLTDGLLKIQVLEGRFGEVLVDSDDEVTIERVARYLSPLEPGAVIDNRTLQRTFAVLGDVPGLEVVPLINAGQTAGTGDVLVLANTDKTNSLRFTVDNHGNRSSGVYRGSFLFTTPRILQFGDSLSITGLASNDEQLGLISFDYSWPIGGAGVRAAASHSRTSYNLGNLSEAISETKGGSENFGFRLTYPLVRTDTRDIQLNVAHQRKWLRTDTTFVSDQLRSERVETSLLPVGATWQERDSWLGGGLTQASVTWTLGYTKREAQVTLFADDVTHRDFFKTEIQAFRLQSLPFDRLDARLFALVSTQFANRDLDSSEQFSLGGANAVRAYPQGESSGSQGWLTQLELRASLGAVEPFVFYDSGHILGSDEEASSTLQGAGVGLRANWHSLNGNFAVAWKVDPQDATSDQRQRNPRAWFSLNYQL